MSCSQPWYLGVVDFRADIMSPMSVCISIVLESSMCLLMCSTIFGNNEQFCWFLYHVALNWLSLNVQMRKVLDMVTCSIPFSGVTMMQNSELMCCPKVKTLVVFVYEEERIRDPAGTQKDGYGNSITMLDCWTYFYPAYQCILVALLVYSLLHFGFLDCIQAIQLKLFQGKVCKLVSDYKFL
jgi:hypothetical protein